MKTPASKIAELAQIQPKSQFLFHENLPPSNFSIMTLLKIVRNSDRDLFSKRRVMHSKKILISTFSASKIDGREIISGKAVDLPIGYF